MNNLAGLMTKAVFYFAPDSLQWDDLGRGYTDFLRWAFDGNLDEFYEGLRWSTWERDVAGLSGDEAIHTFPPLWVKVDPPSTERSRRPVPVTELWGVGMHMARQLNMDFGLVSPR